jgi:VWFA-related protein
MRYVLTFWLALLVVLSPITGLAQNPNPQNPAGQTTPPQNQIPKSEDDDVVRISTNLIQLDVTVTDKNGHAVPDLNPEDFEIQENGRNRAISNFSYIGASPGVTPATTRAVAPNGPPRPPVPPARIRSEQIHRTFALVVDDLGLSFESMHRVPDALRKFVDQTMQPGDLVAIIRTGSGSGALQQFTADKAVLYAAIDRIRWNPTGRGRSGAFETLRGRESAPDEIGKTEIKLGASPTDEQKPKVDPTEANAIEEGNVDNIRHESNTVGTLSALNYIVRGLRDLPGRKSVVLLSDGFQLQTSRGTEYAQTREALRRLTDLCNRASVVIYTISATGVVPTGPLPEDNVSSIKSQAINKIRSNRAQELFDNEGGLDVLAEQTGGLAVRNTNDLGDGLRRVVADQIGYYLIGYQPDEQTFDAARLRYNDIKVVLKRSGFEVRYRAGFYNVSDDRSRKGAAPSRAKALAAALMSPFNASEAQLRLTTIFGNDAREGSYVRSYLHIRAQDLTFTPKPDGTHQVQFDLLALTFGDTDKPIDQVSRTYKADLNDREYQNALRAGIVYKATVPIKKAGSYQLRVAVRDVASGRIGSASQFIEVPDLTNDRLALSGIAAFGSDPAELSNRPAADHAAGPAAEEDPEAGAATRRLRKGMLLSYGCYIYNARLDKGSGRPQLQTQVRLFRNGQEVFTADPLAYEPSGDDMKRLPLTGAVQLGTGMPPGEYVLQVVVRDPLAKANQRIATQWIDFEIVP